MIRKPLTVLVIIGIILAPVESNVSNAGFIVNGSFEQNNGIGQLGYANSTGGPVISATGWSSSGYNMLFNGAVDPTASYTGQYGHAFNLWGPSTGGGSVNNGLVASPDGGYFIGSDGASDTGPISQTMSGLIVGHYYSVSFWWAGAQQQSYNGGTTEQWKVAFGNSIQSTTVVNNVSHGFTGWMYTTLTFLADQSNDVLSFTAVGTPNSSAPPFSLLDGVTVSNAVPEPSSVLMLGIGLAGFVIVGRRRNRRTRSLAA